MPKERNKNTSSWTSNVEGENSLGVTQLLDELRNVPSVGPQDKSFSLEDVLAEFGSGKSAKLFADDVKVYEPVAEESAKQVKVAEKKPKPEPAAKKEAKPEPAKKEPKLITNIVRPWEDGKFGDLDLEAKPEPAPWKKKGKVDKAEKAEKAEKPKKPAENGRKMHDTIPHIPAVQSNELFDDDGNTRGFRIKKKDEPEFNRELPNEFVSREEKKIRGQRSRVIMLLLLCLPVCYLSFAPQVGLPLPGFIAYAQHPFRFVLCLVCAQLLSMLLGLNVISRGIASVIELKPCGETVVLFANLACIAHAVSELLNHGLRVQMPYCAVMCVTMFFSAYGLYLKRRAWLRSCKAAGASKEPMGVFAKNFYGEKNVFKHGIEDRETFVGNLTSRDGAGKFWSFFAVIVIVASIVFAGVASFNSNKPEHFLWGLAAISSLAAPFFLIMCYAHPFALISKKLAGFGAAIAGWYAAQELSGGMNIIIKDTDLFPHGYVKLHGLKVFGNHTLEKTLSCTTSIIKESGSGLYKLFAELLKSQFGKTDKVYNLRYHESGGVEGEINGDRILLGTAGFMLRSGVRVTENVNVKNAVFVAINAEIAGVYNVTYKVNAEVQNSLFAIARRKIKPVLATVDFNLTPTMVESNFELRTGTVSYPKIEERLDLASDDQIIERHPSAVVSRAGLAPMAYSVLAARKLKSATIRNVILSATCACFGMLVMFYIVFCGSIAASSPNNVFLYNMLWTIPAYIVSKRAGNF